MRLIVALLVCSVYCSGACAASWANGYGYCREISVDNTKVPNTDQTDFPVLISSTVTSWKTTGNAGNVQNTVTSGAITVPADLIFTSDNAGTTLLKWEVESYTANTGNLITWVKIPTLATAAPTLFYVFYGNASVSTFQGDINGTWETNFKGVYHLKTGTGAVGLTDSTSNAKNIVLTTGSAAAITTGQINGAGDFNGNYYNNPTFGTYTFPFTYSVWATYDTTGTMAPINYTAGGNDGTGVGGITNGASMNPFYVTWNNNVYSFTMITVGTGVLHGMWVVLNAAGTSATAYLCISGTVTSQTLATSATISGTPSNIAIAARDASPTVPIDGKIDEARFTNTNRSADWIATECNNQTTPATFYTVGNEVVNVSSGGLGLKRVIFR